MLETSTSPMADLSPDAMDTPALLAERPTALRRRKLSSFSFSGKTPKDDDHAIATQTTPFHREYHAATVTLAPNIYSWFIVGKTYDAYGYFIRTVIALFVVAQVSDVESLFSPGVRVISCDTAGSGAVLAFLSSQYTSLVCLSVAKPAS